MKKGHNVFLTGAAGSGKTHLLNDYIRFLKDEGVGVGITASTGIAATHIGGLTIHSWAGIGIASEMSVEDCRAAASSRRVAKRFKKTKTLVIDEISMLDADRLDLVDRVARLARGSQKPFGGLQIIFCGDFFQLPPVSSRINPEEPLKEEKDRFLRPNSSQSPARFAYHAASWRAADLKICYLTERFRHGDARFLEVLDAIRGAEVNGTTRAHLHSRLHAKLPYEKATKLYSHNIDVDAENAKELSRLPGKEKKYAMSSDGIPQIAEALKKGCLAPEKLTLKRGAEVMFVKNNFEEGYVNGTLGKVIGFDGFDFPIVETARGERLSAHPAKWSVEENGRVLAEIKQVPLRLAWAITIHKSQGMTLDAAEIDLSGAFEKGMGYVALSRVRGLEGIRLLGLNDTALEVNEEVLEFDRELRRQSEAVTREFLELVSAGRGKN